MKFSCALALTTSYLAACVAAQATSDNAPANFTVAFVGDTGVEQSARDVLNKLKEWNVHALFHGGDFSYLPVQSKWWNFIDETIGPDFPMISTSGNHDLSVEASFYIGRGFNEAFWGQYAKDISARHKKAGARCKGSVGEMELCYYNGIVVLNLGYGQMFDEKEFHNNSAEKYARFINESFRKYPKAYWRICHYHMPIAPYTSDPRKLGEKNNTEFRVMNACAANGAIIANAHHHVYERTHLMENFATQAIGSAISPYRLKPGSTLQWTSGLGGESPGVNDGSMAAQPFWAKKLVHTTAIQNSTADRTDWGALLCTFNPGGKRPSHANCKFRDVQDKVHDEFMIYSYRLDGEGDSPFRLE